MTIHHSSIYKSKGYESRRDYLEALSDDYDVPLENVLLLADLLGPNEDFDGLVTEVNDLSDLGA